MRDEKERAEKEKEDLLLQCPPNIDPNKWKTYTRQQKMQILGISEKEWGKMSREVAL